MALFDDSGGAFEQSIRQTVEADEFTEPIVHYPLVSDSGPDGSAEPKFGDPRDLELKVTSPSAEDFEIRVTGQADDLQYVLTAMRDRDLGEDDRVEYDNGLSTEPYRLTEPRPTTIDGETFVKWSMVPDTRGEGDEGTGSDPTDEPPSDDPDSPPRFR